MSFPKYAEYKDSGVEWLGIIPSHWSAMPLKLAARNGEKTFTDGDWIETPFITDEGIRLIQCGNIGTGRYEEQGFRYIADETFKALNCTEVVPNDVLICRLQSSRTILAGRACLAPDLGVRAVTSVDNCILKPSSEFDSRYIVYQLSTTEYLTFIKLIARGGTRDRISRSMLGGIGIAKPPREEQIAVATFLDQETAKIDALIAEQQRLIELLKEKRQAVISHAVTKGLDPNVPMKPSGIEWLGDVPAHWVITKFGQVANVVRGGSPRPAGDPTLFNGDFSPWVTVAEITKDDEIDLTETSTFLTEKGSKQSRLFKAGTLLLTNSGGSLGVPKILRINANANDGVLGFFDLSINQHFAFFYLTTLTEHLRETVKKTGGSTQINLNTHLIKQLALAVPPDDEAERIVELIFNSRDQYRKLEKEAERAIELLKERRTALISAAVTGKIDVRQFATEELVA